MAVRNILLDGDPLLRKKSREVTEFNKRLWELIDDMIETMDNANGVGLAAPQVGVLRRVIIINTREEEDSKAMVFINPVIVDKDGEQINQEGCLSIPHTQGTVKRPKHVKLKAQDRNGKYFEVEGNDYLAIAMCHEVDHLEGILYTDLATELFEVE